MLERHESDEQNTGDAVDGEGEIDEENLLKSAHNSPLRESSAHESIIG